MFASRSLPRPFGSFGLLLAAALLGGLAAAAPGTLSASPVTQTAPPADAPEATAVRASGELRADGILDEPAWAEAPVVTEFFQREPAEGEPVSRPTEVRIVYDDEAIWIGARLADPDGPTTRMGRRDMPLLDSDWFSVTFDSYHDLRTGFRFQTNPSGIRRDAAITMSSGEEEEDDSWDPVWEVATRTDEDGWWVEMRIPFSQLRFRRGEEQVWGLQLERIVGRRGEIAHFAFVPRSAPGGIPSYGRLVGLRGIESGRRLELLPYAVARGEYVDPGPNPFRDGSEYAADVGADLAYRLTPDLTLNATLNPDFGQVEVDPAVVELGVYETFFPERRPFFVEGSEIFDFTGNTSGGRLFYSRRIGRGPQLAPPTAESDVPDATRILGAAKVSGRAGGWSVGVLDAVTGTAEARYLEEGGERSMTAEPLSNYFVTRVRRDVPGGRSAWGAALTSVARDLGEPEAEAAFHSDAWGGGLDFRHEWSERRWQVSGSLAGSLVRGSTDAITRTQRLPHHYFQRPDADHLEVDADATSLTGYSAGMNLTRQAGERWLGSVAAAATSPSYEVNDLGFAMRTDRRDLQARLTHRQTRPGDFLRDWSVTGSVRHEQNFDGDVVQQRTDLQGTFRHLDYWSVNVFLQHSAEAQDDRSTRGGPLLIRPGERVAGISGSTDPRRRVSARANVAVVDGDYGGDGWEVGGNLQWRTSPWWTLSIGPYFSAGRVAAQYVGTVPDPDATETFGARYLFAPLDFRQLSADIRFNLTVSPGLSLETYVQPLIFAFDYGEVGSLAAPGGFEFEPHAEQPELDRTLRSLRGNAVLRWEWRTGSTLYVAWQQRRQGVGQSGAFHLGDDVRAIFRAPPDDILVLKVTYWLNP